MAAEALTTSTVAVRRRRSMAEKRQMVEETYREGASVRSVSQAHNVPSNQLFHWRKLHREGLLGDGAGKPTQSELVAVQLVSEQQPAVAPGVGAIQLETGKGRLSISGAADAAVLRVVLEQWLR
jgi:transposase